MHAAHHRRCPGLAEFALPAAEPLPRALDLPPRPKGPERPFLRSPQGSGRPPGAPSGLRPGRSFSFHPPAPLPQAPLEAQRHRTLWQRRGYFAPVHLNVPSLGVQTLSEALPTLQPGRGLEQSKCPSSSMTLILLTSLQLWVPMQIGGSTEHLPQDPLKTSQGEQQSGQLRAQPHSPRLQLQTCQSSPHPHVL